MEPIFHKKRNGGVENFLVLCIEYRNFDSSVQLQSFWMLFLSITLFFDLSNGDFALVCT